MLNTALIARDARTPNGGHSRRLRRINAHAVEQCTMRALMRANIGDAAARIGAAAQFPQTIREPQS